MSKTPLTIMLFLIIGRNRQSPCALSTGIAHAVGVPPAGPVSVSLQVVEPWSNAQLCPPPVTGCAGSLCSKTELSGTKTEPAVAVNIPGDQVGTAGGWPATKPPGGNVEPSAHTAQAKFYPGGENLPARKISAYMSSQRGAFTTSSWAAKPRPDWSLKAMSDLRSSATPSPVIKDNGAPLR